MADVKRKIGGSLIAGILGKSKWATPLDAFLQLTDPASVPQKTGEDIDRGNFLEPAIRAWTNKKLPDYDFQKPEVMAYPEWEWATVSPDGLTGRHPAVTAVPHALLEIKAPRRDDALEWGEEWSDEIPTDALLQTHWGLMVTNAREGVVAALLGGELRLYRVKRDLDLEARMLAKAKEFVEQHVLPNIPPPAVYGDDARVFRLHPANKMPHRPWDTLTKAEQEMVVEYLGAHGEEKAALRRLEEYEPVVKTIIGDHDGIQLPDGRRLDWKLRKGATRWKGVGEALLPLVPEEERERLLATHVNADSRALAVFGKVKK